MPLLFTAVHLALIALAAESGDVRSQQGIKSAIRPVALQEDGAVRWDPIRPKPFSPIQKIAVILNLPALFIGIPIAATLFHGSDLASLYGATPFVPLLWFFVGHWLDCQLGYIPVRPRRRMDADKIARVLATLLCVVLFLLSIAGLTPLNHHRDSNSAWIGAGSLLWFGLMFTIVRRSRPEISR